MGVRFASSVLAIVLLVGAAVISAQITNASGFYPVLTAGGRGAPFLAAVGVTVAVRSRTNVALVFPTATPTGGDLDLGAPNGLCGWVLPGIDERCYTSGLGLNKYGPLTTDTGRTYPFVNCSATSCPGDGCGGARWLVQDPYRNNNNNNCTALLRPRTICNDPDCLSVSDINCPVINPGANCEPQGRVMVIKELGSTEDNPDDEVFGGNWTLTFTSPVFLSHISVLDIDFSVEKSGKIYLYSANGTLLATRNIVDPGNNGFQVDTLLVPEVTRVVITFPGSGSINNIVWCVPAKGNITVNGTWDRICDWNITKTIVPSEHRLFIGEEANSTVTTTVDKTCRDRLSICADVRQVTSPVTLSTGFPLEGIRGGVDPDDTRTDMFEDTFNISTATDCQCRFRNPDGTYATRACPPLPFNIYSVCQPNDGKVCSVSCYSCRPVSTPVDRSFTVTFLSASPATVGDFSIKARYHVPSGPMYIEDDSATVSDSEGSFPPFVTSVPATRTSVKTLRCAVRDQPPSHEVCNSTVVEATTLQTHSAEAFVDLYCYQPTITKTATGTFDRRFRWTIDKWASSVDERPTPDPDTTQLVLAIDGTASSVVDYTVVVTAVPTDENVNVDGSIVLGNPHPTRSLSLAVTDVLTVSGTGAIITGSVACPVGPIPPAGSQTCVYSMAPSALFALGDNVATTSLNGFDFTAHAAVTFGSPAHVYGADATVVDVFAASATTNLGSPTASTGTLTFTYRYPRTFDALTCTLDDGGSVLHGSWSNVATVTWSGGSASDHWTVKVDTPCNDDCPCEYFVWPVDGDPEADFCVTTSSSTRPHPEKGASLCWS